MDDKARHLVSVRKAALYAAMRASDPLAGPGAVVATALWEYAAARGITREMVLNEPQLAGEDNATSST